MRRKMCSLLLVVFCAVTLFGTTTHAAVSSYISNKAFAGIYYLKSVKNADGKKVKGYKKVTSTHGAYYLTIKKITKKGKIQFLLERLGRNGSPIYMADTSGTIRGKKVSFKYKDTWGNEGKGTLILNSNKTLTLTTKTTKLSSWNRGTLEVTKGIFAWYRKK